VLAVESGLAKMSQRASADILLDALYGDFVLLAFLGIPVKLTAAYIDSLAELVLHDATSDRKTELSPKSGGELIGSVLKDALVADFAMRLSRAGDVHWLLSL
jgi:hypothetical protein